MSLYRSIVREISEEDERGGENNAEVEIRRTKEMGEIIGNRKLVCSLVVDLVHLCKLKSQD